MTDRPLEIAMYTSSLPEPGRKPGGVDVLILRVANHLVRRGHRVRIYSYAPTADGLEAELVSLRPARIRYASLGRMLVLPALLNRVDFRGDVLHLHGDDWFFLRRQMPTVRTFYGSARDESRTATSLKRRASQAVLYRLELLAARQATTTYSLMPDDGAAYGSRGALNCGVDIAPASSETRSANPAVLFVGTWAGRKRGGWLAEQFARHVLPTVPKAELWMVSDHIESAPWIRAIDKPSDAELARLYRECWAFCLPSTYEGFGIPYVEAMAAGTPVVATPNPGARYLLDDGRAGLLVEDEDLGETLAQVLMDSDRRDALARAGLTRAEAFSWEKVIASYEAAYADAIERWRARHAATAS